MDFIEKYPDNPWNWQWISSNSNITLEIIEKYPDKPWNWKSISSNPNLTLDMIEKYPDKPWDWFRISLNKFGWTIDNVITYYNKRKEYTIQLTQHYKEELISVSWHPNRVIHWCLDIHEQSDMFHRWNA